MFKKIEHFFDTFFNAVQPIPPGMVQMQAESDADLPYKLHLRVEENGSGILIINASTVLHLNQTATEYMYHLINGQDKNGIPKIISDRYQIEIEQAQKDMEELFTKIDTLMLSEDLDPVTFLDIERVIPYSQKLSAPYRLDCALTYQLPDGNTVLAPHDRVDRELSSGEWKSILEKAAGLGIPHINFTGGEPTLRDDLHDLISKAEELGLVTGLLTDGFKFATKKYLTKLLDQGLDHVMVIFQDKPNFWKALSNLIPENIAFTVHITITSENAPDMGNILKKLADAGTVSISLSANSTQIHNILKQSQDRANDLGLKLVWDLPVPYSKFHPIALELANQQIDFPKGAGNAWLYVEPDGDVLPTQGDNKVLGNILRDPWKKIWKNR